MPELENKPWYQSKGCIGSLIVISVAILGAIGMAKPAEEITAAQGTIVDWVMQIGVIVGGVVALVGRITAKTNVTR